MFSFTKKITLKANSDVFGVLIQIIYIYSFITRDIQIISFEKFDGLFLYSCISRSKSVRIGFVMGEGGGNGRLEMPYISPYTRGR